ncbi:MAG: hypothetical protein AAGF97_12075 [Planctomycetota bacterium]
MTDPAEHHEDNIVATGPWPFITQWLRDGRQPLWSSRHHRKGLSIDIVPQAGRGATSLWRCLWMPRRLNWWIGGIFALGASLFAGGSVLSLMPSLAESWSLSRQQVNAVFFAGSIPFTTAAYLQVYQAANAPLVAAGAVQTPLPSQVLLGWRPREIGWLSCVLQFIGTILFNFNTFDAMLPSLTWVQQDVVVWIPNAIGSVLFLMSGYLAFIETCHAYWRWEPKSLTWWIVFMNLLGCVGFMVSAAYALRLPEAPDPLATTVSTTCTLLGAIGFFLGALMMLPEAYLHRSPPP